MKYLLGTLSLMILCTASVQAQAGVEAMIRQHGLGSSDAGAIMNYYTNPSVPNTYEYIDPKTVGLPDEDPSKVINVEKKDLFGKIIIDPETNETE